MNTTDKNDIDKFYNLAIQFTKSHYENFPVISFFIKKDLRKHVSAIYQFARQADDIADEGNFSQDARITKLNNYESNLRNALTSKYDDGFWKIISHTINKKKLNPKNFLALLKAFKQDVWKVRYKDINELFDYCKNSANPVGRLILELHGINERNALYYSDKICTALQLTNFYQDVSVDLQKGRIYLPENEMSNFHVNADEIQNMKSSENFRSLIKFQVNRARLLFKEGRDLLKYLPFRLKFQILVTVKGGEAILKKIEDIDYNVLDTRPTLSKMDFIKIFIFAIFRGK